MRRLVALTICALAIGHACPVFAQPGKELARKAFEEGFDLEKKNDFQGAIAKYKEAEAITATAGTVYHEGFCLEQLGKLTEALAAYEKAIDLARTQQKGDVEKATEVRAEPLRRKVPQLSLKVNPTNADVLLDGNPVSSQLLDGRPFRVDPGEHTFTVRAQGYKETTRHVSAQLTATTPVEIVLEKAPSSEQPITAPPPIESTKPDYTLPIVTTAGAVVLIGGGIASFLVAGSSASDAESTCKTTFAATCDHNEGKIRTFDTLALVGWIGGAGLAVVSVLLWTKGPKVSASASSVWLEGKF